MKRGIHGHEVCLASHIMLACMSDIGAAAAAAAGAARGHLLVISPSFFASNALQAVS